MGDVIVRSYGILKSSGLPDYGIVPYLRLNIWLSPQGSKRDGIKNISAPAYILEPKQHHISGLQKFYPDTFPDNT